MRTPDFLAGSFVLFAALAVASTGNAAESYPTKVIRIISPVPAGGLSDIALRPLAHELSKRLGQPVIVENRPAQAASWPVAPARKRSRTATRSVTCSTIR